MKPILIAARWLLVPLAFSLFATVAQAENRTVNVTVSVVSATAQEEAVVDANVTLTGDTGSPPVQAKTGGDGNAVVSVPVGPAGWFSSAATIKVTAEKNSQTASETINVRGRDFKTGGVAEVTRTLKLLPQGVVPGSKTIELTVAVVGDDGNPVSAARVNIYQGMYSRTVVAPPMLQRETDTNGVAQFPIPIPPGQTLGFSIEVGREDMQTQVHNIDLGPRSEAEVLEQFFLNARPATGGTGEKEVITVGIDVQNESFDFLEGARVLISGDLASERYVGVTNGAGLATIPVWWASASPEKAYGVDISKEGYRDKRITIQLSKQQVGKTIRGAGVTLERIGTGTIKVITTVTNKKNGAAVGDATVILEGVKNGGFYKDTTNGAGIATFYVKEIGDFTAQITHDSFLASTGKFRLLSGATENTLPAFQLEPKASKDQGEDTITVTVLGKDSTDEKSKPAPIKGAYVKAGTISAETDESGVATLTAAFAEKQEVTVQANGYKVKTATVPVNKILHMSAGSGKWTFTLDPEVSENSPVRLQIEVRDVSGKAIPGAKVDFSTAAGTQLLPKEVGSKSRTDDSGNFVFNSNEFEEDLEVLRKGLLIDVKAKGFKEVGLRSIPAEMLKPSTKTGEFIVQLDQDWSDLEAALTALEQKVAAWQKDRGSVSQAAESDLIDKARAAQKHAEQVLKEIEAAKDAFGITFGPGGPDLPRCRKAKELKEDVQLCEAKANQKAEELKRLLDAASASAANCSAEGDPDIIKKDYTDATKLLIEIGMLNKKAGKDRDELVKLAAESSDGKKLLADMDAKVAEIGDDKKTADETVSKATTLYARFNDMVKGFAARRLQLYAEFGDFKSNYHVVEISLPPNLETRIQAVENALNPRDSVPDAPKPKTVPESVSSAPGIIAGLQGKAEQFVSRYRSAACEVDTMDDVVKGIDEILTNSGFEIGLADLPKLANDCDKKIAGASEVEVPDLSTLNDLGAMTRAADQVEMKFHAVATSSPPPANSQRLFGPQNPPAKSKAHRGDELTIIVYQKLAEQNATPTPTAADEYVDVPSVATAPDAEAMSKILSNAGFTAVFNAATPKNKEDELKFSSQDPVGKIRKSDMLARNNTVSVYINQKWQDLQSPSAQSDLITVPDVSSFNTPEAMLAAAGPDMIGMIIATNKTPPKGWTKLFAHQDPLANTKSERGKPLKIFIYQSLADTTAVASTSPTPTPDTAVAASEEASPADNTSSGSGDWVGTWGEAGPNGLKISRAGSGYILIGSFTDGKPVQGAEQGGSLVFSWEGDVFGGVGMGFIVQGEKMEKEHSKMRARYTFTHNGDKLDMVMEMTEPGGKVTRNSIPSIPRVGN